MEKYRGYLIGFGFCVYANKPYYYAVDPETGNSSASETSKAKLKKKIDNLLDKLQEINERVEKVQQELKDLEKEKEKLEKRHPAVEARITKLKEKLQKTEKSVVTF